MGGGHLAIARAALRGGAPRDSTARQNHAAAPAFANRPRNPAIDARVRRVIFNQRSTRSGFVMQSRRCSSRPRRLADCRCAPIAPTGFLIGASCGTPAEARAAQRAGADTIGIGAVYATSTKTDAGAAIGLDGLRAVMNATTLPCAAIGGIGLHNIGAIAQTGVAMACVISAIARAGSSQGDAVADCAAMENVTRELSARFASSGRIPPFKD